MLPPAPNVCFHGGVVEKDFSGCFSVADQEFFWERQSKQNKMGMKPPSSK